MPSVSPAAFTPLTEEEFQRLSAAERQEYMRRLIEDVDQMLAQNRRERLRLEQARRTLLGRKSTN